MALLGLLLLVDRLAWTTRDNGEKGYSDYLEKVVEVMHKKSFSYAI